MNSSRLFEISSIVAHAAEGRAWNVLRTTHTYTSPAVRVSNPHEGDELPGALSCFWVVLGIVQLQGTTCSTLTRASKIRLAACVARAVTVSGATW